MNNSLRWAAEAIQASYSAGVRHAVISPGSRSTPLTMAAAMHPKLQTHVVLDERSAAFIALGMAKDSGKPAILICTSGTAVANYLPAVVEARESGVPMMLFTADRPPSLRGIGSSQTIDQIKLFGDYAVFFHETGEPVSRDEDLAHLNYLCRHAVQTAIDKGGAAHFNLAFRKPLEPAAGELNNVQAFFETALQQHFTESSNLEKRISPSGDLKQLLTTARKLLIICGPAHPHHRLDEIIRLAADRFNAPLIAEPGSGVSGYPNQFSRFEQFLRFREHSESLKPDLILRFGDQPFTKSLLTILETWNDVPVIHFTSRSSIQDHARSVTHTVYCEPGNHFELPSVIHSSPASWIDRWTAAENHAQQQLELQLRENESLTDGHLFHHLPKTIPDNWQVMIANSFPARDMALFHDSRPGQFVNRGAAGIDGTLSTAVGLSISSEQPVCCFTGDLAFLHDSNALLSLRHAGQPIIVVIINNNGGNIFRMLPVYEQAAVSLPENFFLDYFETPQQVSIDQLAAAHKLSYRKINSVNELHELNLQELSEHTVIECITDSDSSMNMRHQLWNFTPHS